MSRTLNTRPLWLQRCSKWYWRETWEVTVALRGRPRQVDQKIRRCVDDGVFGGMWTGYKTYRTEWHRAERKRVRSLLRQGVEPDPRQPRNDARWRIM